jgi:endonuclease G
MKRHLSYFALALVAALASYAWRPTRADFSARADYTPTQASHPTCAAQSPGALPVAPPPLERGTMLLCYDEFVVKFSGISRTPIWSAERLDEQRVLAARTLLRVDSFHPDPTLGEQLGPTLSDFRGSRMDRGHLSPNGDMSSPQAAYQSFSLANIVPQDPQHNRRLWADIETAVRRAASHSDVYVVTGPLFIGAQLRRLNQRVLVPTHLYKAVYAPRSGLAGVYVSPNDPDQTYETLSLADFTARYGIVPFPDAGTARNSLSLPSVVRHR